MKDNDVMREESLVREENVLETPVEEIKGIDEVKRVENSVNNGIVVDSLKEGSKENKTENKKNKNEIADASIDIETAIVTEDVTNNSQSHDNDNGNKDNMANNDNESMHNNNNESVNNRVSYASKLSNMKLDDNELFFVPTALKENGEEVVLFEEELVKKGSENKLSNMQLDDNELFFVPTALKESGEEVVLFEEELVKKGSEKWKFTICGYSVGCRMGVNELKYNVRRMWGISTIASRLGRPIKMDKMAAEMCKEGSERLGYARVLVEINAEKDYIDNVEINYVDDLKNVKKTKL
ncbi:hypothetical protein Tco_1457563 [Tanacetum coccineum]